MTDRVRPPDEAELETTRAELETTRAELEDLQRRAGRRRERFEAIVDRSERRAVALARSRAEVARLRNDRFFRFGERVRPLIRRLAPGRAARRKAAPAKDAGSGSPPGGPAPATQPGRPSVAIHIGAPDRTAAATWGDTAFAEAVGRAFERRGWVATIHSLEDGDAPEAVQADLALHLFGIAAPPVRPGQLSALWIISHPDLVTARRCREYDVVFVASDRFRDELAGRIEIPVHALHQATDPDRFHPDPTGPEHDLLFVGNSRRVRRPVLDALAGTTHELAVYGSNWTPELLDPGRLRGSWIPNDELHRYYSSARIVLSDTWPDMRDEGFISNRVYDVLACGGFVLSDHVDGMEAEFDGAVATYRGPDELERLVDRYLGDPDERSRRSARGREAVLARHTFHNRVERIIEVVEPLRAPVPG